MTWWITQPATPAVNRPAATRRAGPGRPAREGAQRRARAGTPLTRARRRPGRGSPSGDSLDTFRDVVFGDREGRVRRGEARPWERRFRVNLAVSGGSDVRCEVSWNAPQGAGARHSPGDDDGGRRQGPLPVTRSPGGVSLRFRSVFLSDLHLGTRACKVEFLHRFLDTVEADYVFLVGDIVDMERLKRRWYWPPSHRDVLRKLLDRPRRGVGSEPRRQPVTSIWPGSSGMTTFSIATAATGSTAARPSSRSRTGSCASSSGWSWSRNCRRRPRVCPSTGRKAQPSPAWPPVPEESEELTTWN